MSLLPTTRINSLVSSTNNVGADPGHGAHPGQEDILLVDFQPVVVPSSQILSSPSTTTSTAMYQLPPPCGPLGGPHLVGLNNHHPSISSDGKTTPISATGSSGKNQNNFSLVSLSNHVHPHSNNTSRDESDLNYHPHHQLHPPVTPPVIQTGGVPYDDENDEFARHQALAQPSYMLNKRRSRRFNSRDNHMWDNANHTGMQQPAHISSSLSSSEDSDTGFLMGTRKTAYTRRSVQRVVDPHPTTIGGNASPSATTGLLPNMGSRKRVRRKRPSARNRKPVNNQHDKIPNPSDVLSLCCCLCEDDMSAHSNNRSHARSSIKSRYLRLTCVIVIAIGITVMGSITVGLQKKVESLDWNIKQLDQAVGSPLATDSLGGANRVTKSAETLENLVSAHNALNATVNSLKLQLDQTVSKLQDLQKQVSAAASKPDGLAEVKGNLGQLGSRVEELSATITSVKETLAKSTAETLKSKETDASSETKPTANTE